MKNQPNYREASIRIRLSTAEKERLEELAWRARKSVSAYVRDELHLSDNHPPYHQPARDINA